MRQLAISRASGKRGARMGSCCINCTDCRPHTTSSSPTAAPHSRLASIRHSCVLSIANVPIARPEHDLAGARERFAALAARDDDSIAETGRSRLFAGEARAPRAVVLLHGLTNCPQQWVPFAQMLAARGSAVVIPRLPGHGARDRRGLALATIVPADVLATANEAIDIAAGLGDRVVVCGLSIGSAIASWLTFARDDIARNVALVPFFGLHGFPEIADRLAVRVLATMPNRFVPWDPRGDGGQVPPYAYSHFATRALAAMLHIGLDAVARGRALPSSGETVVCLNAREPAIDNGLARAFARRLEDVRAGSTRVMTWTDLPANHDLIDPTNALARIDLVYPRVLAEIER